MRQGTRQQGVGVRGRCHALTVSQGSGGAGWCRRARSQLTWRCFLLFLGWYAVLPCRRLCLKGKQSMPLDLTVWNVEHGSAAYIRTPTGGHIAIDLGATNTGNTHFSPLRYLQDSMGVSQLDMVIITNPHLDYIEDIVNFDLLAPRCLVRPAHLTGDYIWSGNEKSSPAIRKIISKYIEIDRRYLDRVSPQADPLLPSNNGGVDFEYFMPGDSSSANISNHSVVTIITYQGVKILLPSDSEPTSWRELLEKSNFREAIANTHVLVASHHGCESGFHAELFDHITPLITIVSDGKFVDESAMNRYSEVSQGWTVNRRNGTTQDRKCLTTRNDGIIDVKITENSNSPPCFDVTID